MRRLAPLIRNKKNEEAEAIGVSDGSGDGDRADADAGGAGVFEVERREGCGECGRSGSERGGMRGEHREPKRESRDAESVHTAGRIQLPVSKGTENGRSSGRRPERAAAHFAFRNLLIACPKPNRSVLFL